MGLGLILAPHPGSFLLAVAIGAICGGFGALAFAPLRKPHSVAVTDRAIVVFRSNTWTGKPEHDIARLDRATRIGPLRGAWAKTTLGEEHLWVHKRYHAVVAAADAALDEQRPDG